MEITKTVVIWDQCGSEPIRFFVLDGDYTRLDGIYINSAEHDQTMQDELVDIVYESDTGEHRVKMLNSFPDLDDLPPGTVVIVAGFFP